VEITTEAVGKIIDPNFAEKLLQENTASLIMIDRTFLNTPHWPYNAVDVLEAEKQIKYPNQCNWSIGPISLIDWRKTVLKDENNN